MLHTDKQTDKQTTNKQIYAGKNIYLLAEVNHNNNNNNYDYNNNNIDNNNNNNNNNNNFYVPALALQAISTPVLGRRAGRTRMEESKTLGCGSLNV